MNDIDLAKIATDVAIDISREVYNDGLKPATQEVGQALKTIVGLFHHVVLHPVRKANI